MPKVWFDLSDIHPERCLPLPPFHDIILSYQISYAICHIIMIKSYFQSLVWSAWHSSWAPPPSPSSLLSIPPLLVSVDSGALFSLPLLSQSALAIARVKLTFKSRLLFLQPIKISFPQFLGDGNCDGHWLLCHNAGKTIAVTLWGLGNHKDCTVYLRSLFLQFSPFGDLKVPSGDPDSSFKYPPSWSETSFHRWHPRHLSRQHPFWNGLNKQI